MSKIHILSKQVTELIAAGEVVERPASVVKEVIENSIDAGANSITVEIKNGGITFIRITDNGSGIDKEDIENAFKSHATSKISSADDLNAINTLGFRGEALASIAAVAKVEILTRCADDEIGLRYCIEGGEKVLFDEAGCPKGTTLIVRDLFFNTPARMKFMKKDVAEANAVAGVVDKIALSHPEVAIRFIRDGKQTLMTSGDGKLINAAHSIFGKEFSKGLIETDYLLDKIRVSGFVSKPAESRPNRSMQFFFLNGRLIKTATGSTALSEAYKNSIMSGKFPSCILNIVISPDLVDVNVHPAKTEARFANEKELFNAIYYCAKNAVNGSFSAPNIGLAKAAAAQYINSIHQVQQLTLPANNSGFWVSASAGSRTDKKNMLDIVADEKDEIEFKQTNNDVDSADAFHLTFRQNDSSDVRQLQQDAAESALQEPTEAFIIKQDQTDDTEEQFNAKDYVKNSASLIKVIGEVFNTYILAEKGENILIIDKHAAHERIIYNRLIADKQEDSSQIVLTPVTVLLSKDEYSVILENSDILSAAGFGIEDFGPGMVLIRECPMALAIDDISEAVIELAGYLVSNKSDLFTDKHRWLLQSIACRAAIKAGDFTSEFERISFVENLLQMPDVRFCPHGRPVYIEMKRSEIEKSFGRT